MHRISATTLALAAVLGAAPGPVAAQDACPDGRVTHVFVDNRSIYDLDEVEDARFGWAYRLANRLHTKTHERFLKRELLLREGDCYDAFRVQDSERILRRFWFISQVQVYGIRQPEGDWHVLVETKDEWTTRASVTVSFDGSPELRAVELAEDNFLGRGMVLGAFLRKSGAARLVGGQFFTPRLFNTRIDAFVTGGRTRVGSYVHQELFYPFVGEVGRFAGRQLFRRREDYFSFSIGAPGERRYLLLPMDEERAEFALAARVGAPGNLTIFGLGITRDRVAFPGFPSSVELVEDADFGRSEPAPAELSGTLAGQARNSSGTRVNLLVGQRNIRFVRRRGLDALHGVHDVETGTEVSLTLGRTLGFLATEGSPDDLFTRLSLYAAAAPGPVILAAGLSVEARHVFSGTEVVEGWRDVLAELNALFYLTTPFERHTFFGRLNAAGGWSVDHPFQLTLGGATGVRGYDHADFSGGRRLLLSAEDRIVLPGPFPDLVDLGATLFADIGHIWEGEVPFGTHSGWRAAVGAGLRVGFPAGTRGVVRMDLALPLEASASLSDVIFRISASDLIGLSTGMSNPQMQRSRRVTTGPDRFNPPR